MSRKDSAVDGVAAAPEEMETQPDPAFDATSDTDHAKSVLEQMLARPQGESSFAEGQGLCQALVSSWSEDAGMLADGSVAFLAASCLIRPAAGDLVLVWRPSKEASWVLSVIKRSAAESPKVLGSSTPLSIEAPRVAISARAVHVVAEDFLTSAENRHAVEGTRTETARVRVIQADTDILRATTGDYQIEGTLFQRVGTWISNTARDARLRARTFLFE